MPAKSKAQYRMMQAIAHRAKPKVAGGPSEAVAREFVDATPMKKKKLFSRSEHGSRMMRD